MAPEVLVIGVDGVSLTDLEYLADNDAIPHIASVLDDGLSGRLESTYPPHSAPAWMSFLTGMNPGKHGVVGFSEVDEDNGVKRLLNFADVDANTVCEILNHHGRTVGVYGVPLTYPPREVDRFMVSGFGSHEDAAFAHPPELVDELQGDYEFKLPPNSTEDTFRDNIRTHGRLMRSLLEEHDPDVFIGVFVDLDSLQHAEHRTEKWEALFSCVDDEVGKLLDTVDDDTCVILMSDHGSASKRSRLILANWLQEQGHLRFKTGRKEAKSFLERLGIHRNSVTRLAKRLGIRRAWIPRLAQEMIPGTPDISHIDFERTKAYSHEFGRIYIREENLGPDEDYETFRSRLRDDLLAITDPETGETVLDEVLTKEEAYNGPYRDRMPDLVPRWPDDYSLSDWRGNDVFVPTGPNHTQEGFYAITAPEVSPGREDADIVDIIPTLLAYCAVPPAEAMDGRVIPGVADDPGREAYPDLVTGAGADLSAEAEADVEERLEELGYL